MSTHLSQEQCGDVTMRAAEALFEYCKKNNIHFVVTGVSGGLDSAVTIAIAKIASELAYRLERFKLISVGVILPCQSTPESVALAREAIKKFGAKEIFYDLSEDFGLFYSQMERSFLDVRIREIGGGDISNRWDSNLSVAKGNIKARLRMITLYHIARMPDGMVLSTDNLSELWMGFWTICGDVGDYGMIQNILKGTELYDIARYLGVPQGIIEARPDDGLGVANGGDEAQLGANYQTVDRVMISLIQNGFNPDGSRDQLDHLPTVEGVDPKIVASLARRALGAAYKRRGTLNLTREELGLPPVEALVP